MPWTHDDFEHTEPHGGSLLLLIILFNISCVMSANSLTNIRLWMFQSVKLVGTDLDCSSNAIRSNGVKSHDRGGLNITKRMMANRFFYEQTMSTHNWAATLETFFNDFETFKYLNARHDATTNCTQYFHRWKRKKENRKRYTFEAVVNSVALNKRPFVEIGKHFVNQNTLALNLSCYK